MSDTLTYIHNLLKEDVNTKKNATEALYVKSLYKYDDYRTARNNYIDACKALEDFEANEW